MKHIPAIVAFVLCFCAGLGVTAYLVTHGHPVFGFFVLCVTGCLSVRSKEK